MITGHRLLESCPSAGLTVESDHDLGPVRRLAALAADTQGFDKAHAERVSVVAAEMATTLITQASSGRMLIRRVERGDLRGVELVATGGPGMDGAGHLRSNGSSPGRTLEAVVGLPDLYDVHSATNRGTVMMARMWGGGLSTTPDRRFMVGSMAETFPGEVVSGDAWAVEDEGTRLVALAADGLGHGEAAAEASTAAVEAFRRHHAKPVEDIAGYIHRALRETRGAAIAVASIDLEAGQVQFCGIGNIYARLIFPGGSHVLVSHFGIAGQQARRIQAFESAWEDGALLVMHSDGLAPRWDFNAYDGLDRNHAQVIAATVMRDAPRAHDDAMVLVVGAAFEAVPATVAAVG